MVAGSLKSILHSVGTRAQNSTQAGVGWAEAVAGSWPPVGKAAVFVDALSPAKAASSKSRAVAQTRRVNPSARHTSGPSCACATPRITATRVFGNDLLTEALTRTAAAQGKS